MSRFVDDGGIRTLFGEAVQSGGQLFKGVWHWGIYGKDADSRIPSLAVAAHMLRAAVHKLSKTHAITNKLADNHLVLAGCGCLMSCPASRS